ncbi:hypothetical protein K2173_014125 [Erythroxylum novogranatense]|uniref:Uncharacterized protein n=1 Tax=Erythroxylum novogranatense TaxID=1862640 RepID=A0AAV8SE13_9ROSI|nr:hypothetical protein K2173_014125 [Erythroxylum novogranatense]
MPGLKLDGTLKDYKRLPNVCCDSSIDTTLVSFPKSVCCCRLCSCLLIGQRLHSAAKNLFCLFSQFKAHCSFFSIRK